MTSARSQQWIMLGLAVAVAGTFWLYLDNSDRDMLQTGASHLPDLYIDQPHWTLFDPQGRADKHMRAKRLEKWSDEAGARLIEPHLQINDQQQRQWLARARQGRLYPDKASIVLEKQVVLRREPEDSGLVIKTAQLRIADKGDTVETEAPVELQAGSWHFSSTGLHSSLGRQRLELLGQVQGELRKQNKAP